MQAGAVGGQKQALGPLELKLQVSACKQSVLLAEPPGQPLDWNPDRSLPSASQMLELQAPIPKALSVFLGQVVKTSISPSLR